MLTLKDIVCFILAAVLLVFSPCSSSHGSHLTDYSELQRLAVDCPERDSCADGTISQNFTMRNCECDSSCDFYKDCCIDGPLSARIRPPPSPSQSPQYKCIVDRASKPMSGVYGINTCRSDYTGPTLIKRNCERNRNNLSDPILAAPATDTIHRETYRNMYCAECNNVGTSGLQSWQILIHCDFRTTEEISDDYIKENLVYSKSENRWGVNYKNSSLHTSQFHKCELAFGLPQANEQYVRRCRPNIVSTCIKGWSRPAIAAKCQSYTAAVYTNETAYRNPHCAICNKVNLSDLSCLQPDLRVTERRTTPMSFTLLLDVNSRDGNRVGHVDPNSRCSNGQKWDPFFKKCRNLVCALPGFTMVNGRCSRTG